MSTLLAFWGESKNKGLSFKELVVIDILRNNGDWMMVRTISDMMNTEYTDVARILRGLAKKEFVQSQRHNLPRTHITYKAAV